MRRKHECPDCEQPFTTATCPGCGWAPSPTATRDGRCAWEAGAGRCWMPATIGTTAARCTWHSYVSADPRHTGYDELERWTQAQREAGVCALWTHYGAEALWSALCGTLPLPERATPCRASGCRHRPDPPLVADWREALAMARLNAPRRPHEPERVGDLLPAPAAAHA